MNISEALSDIAHKRLVLPEFQREYVWNKEQAKKLMAALFKGWPVGGMLTWKTNYPPELKNMPATGPGQVQVLLDGQQRLTTLYLLIRGEIPPYYRDEDIRNDPRDLWVNLQGDMVDFQYYQANKMDDDARWQRVRDCFDSTKSQAIIKALSDFCTETKSDQFPKLMSNFQQLQNIEKFDLPVLTVPTDAPLADAITIFDWTNSQGTKLTDAELALTHVTAEWPQARRVFKEKITQLEKRGFLFDLSFMTRALTVAATRRALFEAIRGVTQNDLMVGWRTLDKVLDYLVAFLPRHANINSTADLGTANALIPIVAFLCRADAKFPDQKSVDHAVNWLHTALIWGRYTGQTDQRLEADTAIIARETAPWADLRTQIVDQRGRTDLQAADLATRGASHPLYKAAFALAKEHGAIDWFNGMPLQENGGQSYKLHSHHIFPSALLYREKTKGGGGYDADNAGHRQLVNEIANRAFLTAESNWDLSDTPPVDYLPNIENAYPGALKNQFIPTNPELWKLERFEEFLAERRKLIALALNDYLTRLITEPDAKQPRPITELITLGENGTLEFKSSWQWDMRENKENAALRYACLKTIAAFLNSEGGTLLIGVEDDGNVAGIDKDLARYQNSKDKFEQNIRARLVDCIGTVAAAGIKIRFAAAADKEVCVVEVEPASERVYSKTDKGQEFYCRVGNTTRALTLQETEEYLARHWPG